MTVMLVPQSKVEDIQINWWNWRPIISILFLKKLITQEQFERMGANGCGGQVTGEQAKVISNFLGKFLLEMDEDQYVLPDGSVVSAEEIDAQRNKAKFVYATPRKFLEQFQQFCALSQGFVVM